MRNIAVTYKPPLWYKPKQLKEAMALLDGIAPFFARAEIIFSVGSNDQYRLVVVRFPPDTSAASDLLSKYLAGEKISIDQAKRVVEESSRQPARSQVQLYYNPDLKTTKLTDDLWEAAVNNFVQGDPTDYVEGEWPPDIDSSESDEEVIEEYHGDYDAQIQRFQNFRHATAITPQKTLEFVLNYPRSDMVTDIILQLEYLHVPKEEIKKLGHPLGELCISLQDPWGVMDS